MKKSYMLIGALVILAISILLPFISVKVFTMTVSASGWEVDVLFQILLFLALGVAGLVYYKQDLGAKSSIALAVISLVLLVWKIIISPLNAIGDAGIMDYLGMGFYLAVVASIAIGILGWKVMKSGDSGVAPTIKAK